MEYKKEIEKIFSWVTNREDYIKKYLSEDDDLELYHYPNGVTPPELSQLSRCKASASGAINRLIELKEIWIRYSDDNAYGLKDIVCSLIKLLALIIAVKRMIVIRGVENDN